MNGLNPAAIIFCVLALASVAPASAQDRQPPPSPSIAPAESLELYLPRTERAFDSATVRVTGGPITEIAVQNPILKAEPISDTSFRLIPLKTGQTRVTVHGEGDRILYDKLITVSESKRVEIYTDPKDPYGFIAYDCSPGCRPVGNPK